MSNRGLFSKRLKLLRKSHGVLSHELADVLGYKHRGIISRFENNKNMPSFDSLIQIADLFAVSLDWLLGRVNDPYNEKVLTSLEEKYAVPLLSIALEKAAIPLPKIYTRTDLRRKNYTHGQRANLIFAALSSYYRKWNIINEMTYEKPLKDYMAQVEEIDLLLCGDLNKPIWDLESVIVAKRERCGY